MKIRIAASLAALAAMMPAPVWAQSSIAIGVPDDVGRFGVSFGVAYDQADYETADRLALDKCRTGPGVTPEVRELCAVTARFDNRCLAIALDPRDGTHGFGWAVLDTPKEAENVALGNCRATAREQREYCVITSSVCDSSAS